MKKQPKKNNTIKELNKFTRLFIKRSFNSNTISPGKVYYWNHSGEVHYTENRLLPNQSIEEIAKTKHVRLIALAIIPRINPTNQSLEFLLKKHTHWEYVFPSAQINSLHTNIKEFSEEVKSVLQVNLDVQISDIKYVGGIITFKKSPKHEDENCYIFPIFVLKTTFLENTSSTGLYQYFSRTDLDGDYTKPNGDIYQALDKLFSGWYIFSSFAFEYDVTLSFAEKDRFFAEEITTMLEEKGYQVFYDRFHQDKLWGTDKPKYLESVFTQRSRYCVLFSSKHYNEDLNTREEMSHALTRAFQQQQYGTEPFLLVIQLDNTKIEAISNKFVPIEHPKFSLTQIASLLLKKLGDNTIPSIQLASRSTNLNNLKTETKMKKEQEEIDVLILTALRDEYDQLILTKNRVESPGWKIDYDSGREYAQCSLLRENNKLISIRSTWCTEMGEDVSAATAGALVERWKPTVLAMSGVCAGKRGSVSQGDVIFADRVWKYDAGKHSYEKDEFGKDKAVFKGDEHQYRLNSTWKHRLQALQGQFTPWWNDLERPIPLINQELWVLKELLEGNNPRNSPDMNEFCPDWTNVLNRLRQQKKIKPNGLALTKLGKSFIDEWLLLHTKWPPNIEEPKMIVDPIATGSAVREDEDIYERLSESMRKVKGIEMESAAIGAVAEFHNLNFLVAKGVQDYGNKDKDDRFRKFAARASAEWLLKFISNLDINAKNVNDYENTCMQKPTFEMFNSSDNYSNKVMSHNHTELNIVVELTEFIYLNGEHIFDFHSRIRPLIKNLGNQYAKNIFCSCEILSDHYFFSRSSQENWRISTNKKIAEIGGGIKNIRFDVYSGRFADTNFLDFYHINDVPLIDLELEFSVSSETYPTSKNIITLPKESLEKHVKRQR